MSWIAAFLEITMKAYAVILLAVFLFSCEEKPAREILKTSYNPPTTAGLVSIEQGDTQKVFIDTEKSVVQWKDTKLMRTGKHKGIVKFKKGELIFSERQLVGGKFVVAMKSIYVTDIPMSDPEPRKNLTNHLK